MRLGAEGVASASMTVKRYLCGIAFAVLAVGGCMTARGPEPAIVLVRDLSAVAGCRFISTVGAPRSTRDVRLNVSHDQYLVEIQRRAALLGGTHLYLINDAALWGGSDAAGAIYFCRTR